MSSNVPNEDKKFDNRTEWRRLPREVQEQAMARSGQSDIGKKAGHNARNAELISMWESGATYEEAGLEHGLTACRVRQIVTRRLKIAQAIARRNKIEKLDPPVTWKQFLDQLKSLVREDFAMSDVVRMAYLLDYAAIIGVPGASEAYMERLPR